MLNDAIVVYLLTKEICLSPKHCAPCDTLDIIGKPLMSGSALRLFHNV